MKAILFNTIKVNACRHTKALVGSIWCAELCEHNNIRTFEWSSGVVICNKENGILGGPRQVSLKRTQKTHVRKFGGVWYQLVETNCPICNPCDLFWLFKYSHCPDNIDCLQKRKGGVFNGLSTWKEIGEI